MNMNTRLTANNPIQPRFSAGNNAPLARPAQPQLDAMTTVSFGKRNKPAAEPQSFKSFSMDLGKIFLSHSAKKGFIVHKGWQVPGGKSFYKMAHGFRTPTRDERVEELSNKIWTKVLQPMMDNPAQTREMLTSWDAEFKANDAKKTGGQKPADENNPIAEYGTSKAIDYLLEIFNADGSVVIGEGDRARTLSKAEAVEKLQLLCKALALAYECGLENKLAGMYELTKTPEFQNAPGIKKGQLSLEALGSVFLKFVQTLANAPGIFPDEVKASIEPLFEDITPIPTKEIKDTIQSEFGRPVEELFDKGTFEETTPKAGSIAQVHGAKYNGERVAVKVVKNHVEEALEGDIDILDPLVHMAKELYPDYDLEEYMGEFKKLLRNECNMSSSTGAAGEKQVLDKCRELFAKDKRIVVPKVYPELTSKRVLTMEWMRGQSLNHFIGSGNKKVAAGYFSVIWDQIFKLGAFQADPHPGNVFYDAERDQYGFLDAGLVCFSPPAKDMDQYTQFASVLPQEELLNFSKMLITLFSRNLNTFADCMLEPATPEYYKKLEGVKTKGVEPQEAARLKGKGDKLKAQYVKRFGGPAPNLANPTEDQQRNLKTLRDEKLDKYVKLLNANYPDMKSLEPKPVLTFLKDAMSFAVDLDLETRYVNILPWKALFVALNVTRDIDPDISMPTLMMNKMYQTFRDNDELSFLVKEGARLMGTEILDRVQLDALFNMTGKGVSKGASEVGKVTKTAGKGIGAGAKNLWKKMRGKDKDQ